MTYDGKILAEVRRQLAETRQKNQAELDRREAEVFEKVPELGGFDGALADIMTRALSRALTPSGVAELEAARLEAEKLCRRRGELLRSGGFAEDYLDELYDCPDCRDTGYIEGMPCRCLNEKYSVEAARSLSKMLDLRGQSFESFNLDYYSGEFDSDKGESPRDAMAANFDLCRKYAESFRRGSPNLLFIGGTGLGKTFLSASIARVVSQKGFSVVYDTSVSILDVFETLKFSKMGEDLPEYREAMSRYLSCDLLIFDDLGTEMTTAMTVSALYTVINTRILGGRSTIVSTNLTPEELRRRYTPQIVSRLEGEFTPVNFVGTDIRLIKNSL